MTAFRLSIAMAALAALAGAASAQTPGTIPAEPLRIAPEPPRPAYLDDTPTGLKTFYRAYGKYQLSVDAAGKAATVKNKINVNKPSSNARVEKAYLMSATYNYARLANGSVQIEGRNVTWFATQLNDAPGYPGFFQSGLADVTSIVKAKIDAAPAGKITLALKEKLFESQSSGIDGETLVVVFSTPSDPKPRTIALLFGGQRVGGDTYEIILDRPINPASSGARAEMGLGISYSYQLSGVQQYSTIEVNGQRVTSAAGGQDDGSPGNVSNGGLITAGGLGDKPKNPGSPFSGPSKPRSDDERYSLLPFISRTDTRIRVDTVNPSGDDNIFFAWFDLSTDAAIDGDEDGDGLMDSWETNGYDHDGDGRIDVDLPALGADPKRKDLFIAYAWMTAGPSERLSHEPSQAVLDEVSAAFDRAPVPNPNGRNGVKVHWKNTGSVAHDDDLNPVWDEFDALMAPKLTAAQRKIYRAC
ncbi:hypothetical protein [Chenggangzhangella methanolivorans]|uniref:hypothetical protein n=1 Tax=Chenggangzhangella methanolivorans TaxID=1437009 RepID=UPI0021BDDACB|nr:hypothetical protein [Chenggangzhangella methanolivorans]